MYFIAKYYNLGIIHDRIKRVSNDEYKCINEQEKYIKRFFNCANYICNNVNQTFNEELLKQVYFLLTNELLNATIINKNIKQYYKNIDCSPYSLSALLHMYIINNIKKLSIEFAFLISNYVMLKKNRWFLMPYEYWHNDYKEAIKSNDLSSLIRIFYDIELVKKEKKPCLLSRDEVIQRIKNIKEELINNYYNEFDFFYL